MNKTIKCIITVLLAVSFAISPLANVLAQTTGPADLAPLSIGKGTIVPNQYIVVLKSVASQEVQASAISTLEASGGKVIFQYDAALNGFAAVLPDKALLELRQNPQVDYIEADQVVSLEPDPDAGKTPPVERIENNEIQTDTVQTGATWGLDRIDQHALPMDNTYTYLNNGAGVNVYIIDTGILSTHTQFGTRADKVFDSVEDGQNGLDCNGHGTHVAGTIGGSTYGVAKGVLLHAVRVLDCDGRGTYSGVIAGINWVAAHHIKPAVANMSLGGDSYAPVNAAVNAAIAKGVTFVIAAGNEDDDACYYSPASTPAAITVGATYYDDARSYYSNWGTCLDIFAPGSYITSSWIGSNTATNTISGTSMATPHVVGVAALYLGSDPTLTPAQVATGLINFSTKNVVLDSKGSVNRLLYSQVVAPLVVPTPIAPSGTIDDDPPIYSWTKITDATQYQIRLYNGTTLVYAQIILASACGATTYCVSAPSTVLAPATTYTWQVRAYVSSVWKTLSAAKTFTITPPIIPILVAPIGTVTDTTPAFTWTKIVGATQYEYELYQDTTLINTQTVLAADCGATTNCVHTPANVLPFAAYSWRARALINSIWENFSAFQAFTVAPITVPTPLTPTSSISTMNPTYTWTLVPEATEYELQLYKDATLIYSKSILAADCGAAESCVITPTTALPRAAYTWQVRALLNSSWNAFSTPQAFTVNLPSVAALITPVGLITTPTPTYSWTRIAWATRYQYQLYRGINLIYTQTISANTCGATANCVHTPTTALRSGIYTWKVRTLIDNVWQAYSTVGTFTLNLPTVPTGINPLGTIADPTPTYSWSKIAWATQYQYQLYKGTTLVYTKTVLASACGSTANCVNTPTTFLARAKYTWKVRAMVDSVWDTYSAVKGFTVAPPTIPTLVKPSNSITDTTPTFSWTKIIGATQYQYQLYKGATLVYTKTILASACGATTYCVNTPTNVLPRAAYSWKVRAFVSGTWRTFSAPKTFTIVAPPTIPTLIKPGGSITDTTPTFSWSKIVAATQYQYQLYQGAALVYTKTVLASTCGATANCVNTPVKVLPKGTYTWKVRAMVGGVWKTFSTSRNFAIP